MQRRWVENHASVNGKAATVYDVRRPSEASRYDVLSALTSLAAWMVNAGANPCGWRGGSQRLQTLLERIGYFGFVLPKVAPEYNS
jgi:hypothetical protein